MPLKLFHFTFGHVLDVPSSFKPHIYNLKLLSGLSHNIQTPRESLYLFVYLFFYLL